MTFQIQPSTVTEGEARASHRTASTTRVLRKRSTSRAQSLIRLLVVAIAMLSTVGLATPVAAQETTDDTVAAESTSGQYIVDFAMDYLGSPYVWAGNAPGGFDCSGFTQFVIANTVGIDIGHGVPGQTGHGAWVDWEAWQPGDLVFFANTYASGISHVGIYIGNGDFIHAENESTGVTISSLYSNYYSGHYYGAVRIG